MSSKGSPYSNEDYKHRLVDRFVSLYLENALNIKIGLWDEKAKDYSQWKVDDRFLELKNLVYQYAGVVPATDQVRRVAENQLYSMILLLKHEGRITNEDALEVPTYSETEINELRQRVETLERKVQELSDRLQPSTQKQTKPSKTGRAESRRPTRKTAKGRK